MNQFSSAEQCTDIYPEDLLKSRSTQPGSSIRGHFRLKQNLATKRNLHPRNYSQRRPQRQQLLYWDRCG